MRAEMGVLQWFGYMEMMTKRVNMLKMERTKKIGTLRRRWNTVQVTCQNFTGGYHQSSKEAINYLQLVTKVEL